MIKFIKQLLCDHKNDVDFITVEDNILDYMKFNCRKCRKNTYNWISYGKGKVKVFNLEDSSND